jgi:hypothetical protein
MSAVTGNQIGDIGVQALTRVFELNRTLKKLYLYGVFFTPVIITLPVVAVFNVCLWSGGAFDTVLSECDHRQPDWVGGCASTGQGARVQPHPDIAGSGMCVYHCCDYRSTCCCCELDVLVNGGAFDTVLSECGRRQQYWGCGCTSTGQGARIESHLDVALSPKYVSHCCDYRSSCCRCMFGVCWWICGDICDTVLSECGHRHRDWRCGCTGTGQGA